MIAKTVGTLTLSLASTSGTCSEDAHTLCISKGGTWVKDKYTGKCSCIGGGFDDGMVATDAGGLVDYPVPWLEALPLPAIYRSHGGRSVESLSRALVQRTAMLDSRLILEQAMPDVDGLASTAELRRGAESLGGRAGRDLPGGPSVRSTEPLSHELPERQLPRETVRELSEAVDANQLDAAARAAIGGLRNARLAPVVRAMQEAGVPEAQQKQVAAILSKSIVVMVSR